MNFPFNRMEPQWEGTQEAAAKRAKKYYENGRRKNVSRKVGIGPGGTGRVISCLRDSVLAKKGGS